MPTGFAAGLVIRQLLLVGLAAGMLQGCAVVTTTASVAGAAVSTAVNVTTTAVDVTADAAGAAVHMATSSYQNDDRK